MSYSRRLYPKKDSLYTCAPCGRRHEDLRSWETRRRLCQNCQQIVEKIRDGGWDDTETFYTSAVLKLNIQRYTETYDGYPSDPGDIEEVVKEKVVCCPLVRLIKQSDVKMTGYLSHENPCLKLYKKGLKRCNDTSLYILSAKVIRPPPTLK